MVRKVLFTCFTLFILIGLTGFGCPELKINGHLRINIKPETSKNLQVQIVVEDVGTGATQTVQSNAHLHREVNAYSNVSFNTDVRLYSFDKHSDLKITTKVLDPKTGTVLGENVFLRHPPKDGWINCSIVFLDMVPMDSSFAEVNAGTAEGMVVDAATQVPIADVSVHSSPDMDTETNTWGHMMLTNILPGSATDLVVNSPYVGGYESSYLYNDDYLCTWLNIKMPADVGIEVPPIALVSREDWDSLTAQVQTSHGIEQDTNRAFCFGKVRNRYGTPIPDAVVSFDPPSGEVIYLDPVDWGFSDWTKVREGYHLSASFAIFNADVHDWPNFDYRLVATHRITGDTIGTFEEMATPPFWWSLVQADIIAEDYTPPAAVSDLAVEYSGDVILTWTAPGDDGTEGQAYLYDIRFSSEPVGADTFDWWWNKAWPLMDPPIPGSPGGRESHVITGLESCFFLVRTADECMNWSGFSNVVSGLEEISSNPKVKLDVLPITSEGNVLIHYSVPGKSPINLSIYTADGRKVTTLVSGSQSEGPQTVTWDSSNITPGLYFCQLKVDGMILTEKVVLLK